MGDAHLHAGRLADQSHIGTNGRHQLARATAAGLLVDDRRHQQVAAETNARLDESLDRGQERRQGTFGVRRAAAIKAAVDQLAGKRRARPPGALGNRVHVRFQ